MFLKSSLGLLLVGIVPLANALGPTDSAICSVYPDPHFTTFHVTGNYNYHGNCDLVLIASEFTDVHIRTKLYGGWAGTTNVAISIGNPRHILEVQHDRIFLDEVDVTAVPPTSVAGYPLGIFGLPGSETIVLDLMGGQEIKILRYDWIETMSVTVVAHGSDFLDAEGMCGKWTAPAPGMVGRDGVTTFAVTDGTLYGEEWQVDTSTPVSDKDLFENATTAVNCTYDSSYCWGRKCQCAPNGTDCCTNTDPQCVYTITGGRSVLDDGLSACDNVTVARGAKANCEFDVFTTGDNDFATKTPAYVNPIPNEPPPQCTEVSALGCQNAGGRCVWRCNSSKTKCRGGLCTATANYPDVQVSECACEIPFNGICDGWFLAILNFLFGWLLAWLFGINLCP